MINYNINDSVDLQTPWEAYWLAADLPFHCVCGKLIRYNAGLCKQVEVFSGDSSVDSVSKWEHICKHDDAQTYPKQELYINAEKRERDLQHEYYGRFESTSEIKPPIQTHKQQTEEHKKLIGKSLTIQKKVETKEQ